VCAVLGGHQQAVAGVDVGAERPGQEGGAAGGDDHRARTDPPRPSAVLPRDARGAVDDAVAVGGELECRMVVEDPHAAAVGPAPHPAHVLGSLQAAAQRFTVGPHRERVAPLRQVFDAFP
jgi:hypothetical protein